MPDFKDKDLEFVENDELVILEDDESLLIIEDETKCTILKDSKRSNSKATPEDRSTETPNIDTHTRTWKIIIVDDDPGVHQATQMALKNFTFEGNALELFSAFSAQEGKKILSELNDEAAAILLDVVMESNHAGLEVIEFVRDSLQNSRVRIILRTGQPGEAPSESVILDYDINDYQLKLDMTRQRLITSLVSALRSYRDLVTIEQQNQLLTNMLARLQDSEHELKRYSHNLELLVSERTEDLQAANEKLKRLANLDGLTQVANRHYFDTHLKECWHKAIEDQTHIALLLVDVDYFKLFNDQYGHLAGDDAIKQVSSALSEALARSHDLVARYGGEEFGIILPQTNYSGALGIAEKASQSVANLQICHEGSPIHKYLTISIGISALIPQAEMEPKSLIEMSDIALYRAKALNRNQICLYRNMV